MTAVQFAHKLEAAADLQIANCRIVHSSMTKTDAAAVALDCSNEHDGGLLL